MKQKFEKDSAEWLILNSFFKLAQEHYRFDSSPEGTDAEWDNIVSVVGKWQNELFKSWKDNHGSEMTAEAQDFSMGLAKALLTKLDIGSKRAKGVNGYE